MIKLFTLIILKTIESDEIVAPYAAIPFFYYLIISQP